MVALQDDDYHRNLRDFFSKLTVPAGIVVVSSHWKAAGPLQVTSSAMPETLHSYQGFPDELFRIRYPAPGSPELALQVASLLSAEGLQCNINPVRGLDYGAWMPMRIAFPEAGIPVVQLSMPMLGGPADLLRIGRALKELRRERILLVGSGSAVYNLAELQWSGKDSAPPPWAREFNQWLLDRLKIADIQSLLEYEEESGNAAKAHPTPDHLMPLFFTLGASLPKDRLAILHEGFQYHSLSMLSFALV